MAVGTETSTPCTPLRPMRCLSLDVELPRRKVRTQTNPVQAEVEWAQSKEAAAFTTGEGIKQSRIIQTTKQHRSMSPRSETSVLTHLEPPWTDRHVCKTELSVLALEKEQKGGSSIQCAPYNTALGTSLPQCPLLQASTTEIHLSVTRSNRRASLQDSGLKPTPVGGVSCCQSLS